MTEPIRVSVTGAAGRVSYSLLFRIAAGAMFGPDERVALSLLDVPAALPSLDTTMMELDDCAFPLLSSVRASTDAAEAFAGADWVLLLGDVTPRPGTTRPEALRANGPVMQSQGRAINESAKTATVLVVADPCNTNCLVARSAARDLAAEHWFALTRLDQNRARSMIARKANIPVDQVTRVTVWGNHSPSVFADFHNAWIGDRPAHEVIHDGAWVRDVFEPAVSGRDETVRGTRGLSPAASAAQAILGTVRSLTTPTPLGHWFSAAVVSDGSYGVPRGLVFGFPVHTEDGRSRSIVESLYLDEHTQNRIAANVAELELEALCVADLIKGRTY
jgi:malate dehydrogenase